MNNDHINELVSRALAIEAQEAKEAGALGYMARALTQATMPHSKIEDNEFVRTNGAFTLTMLSPKKVGLPYGPVPRLLMTWMTTEAVRTKERRLELGPTLSGFLAQLGMMPTGGRWGNITRVKEQGDRLFQCSVSCDYNHDNRIPGDGHHNIGYRIAKETHLWWHPTNPNQMPLWGSHIVLSGDFFDEVISNPIPVDMRALQALKGSSLALDIYCWLTYRNSYLKHKTNIPWHLLQQQFGSGYPIGTGQGRRDFKKNFLIQLKKIRVVYKDAQFNVEDDGLVLIPSPTHVKML